MVPTTVGAVVRREHNVDVDELRRRTDIVYRGDTTRDERGGETRDRRLAPDRERVVGTSRQRDQRDIAPTFADGAVRAVAAENDDDGTTEGSHGLRRGDAVTLVVVDDSHCIVDVHACHRLGGAAHDGM